MSFLPLGGIGRGNIVIGADTSGLRGQVRQGMRAARQEMQAGARDIEATGKRASKGIGLIGAAAKAAFLGIGTIVGIGVGAAIQFESAWAGVRKTINATPEELAALRQDFRDLAKEIPVSVNELAQIGETAGALGIARQDVLEFTKVVATLGQTTDVTTEQAATALGQLTNVLKLSDKDYSRFASTLVDLGNKGASTESQILEIASRAGAGASLIGISTDATLAWASAMANLGIEVEAGGSSLQNFFLKAQKLVNDPAGLKTMAAVAGMTGKQFKQAFERDASGALTTFLRGLGQLSSSDQLDVLDTLKLNDIRITRGLLGLANGGDMLAQSLQTAAAAWQANTAAAEEAEKRYETTASVLGMLKNVLQDYFIEAGDQALPFVKALLVFVRDLLPKAITYLGGVWDRILAPAVGRLVEAGGRLLTSFGKLFGNNDAETWSEGATTAIDGVASALAHAADMLAAVVDAFAWLLDNPVIQWLARALILWKGISLAMRIAGGAAGALNSLSGGFLRNVAGGIPGARRIGITPEAQALTGAAGDLTNSARALEGAARTLAKSGAAGAGGQYGFKPGPGNRGGAIQYLPMEPGSRQVGNSILGPDGTIRAVGNTPVERAAYLRSQRQFDAFGKSAARQLYARAADSAARAMATFKGGAVNVMSAAAGLFWPAIIASFGAELVKAPVGDLIAQNTQFKRAGAKIKEDFFGGLVSLLESIKTGSDLFVDLPEFQLGRRTTRTKGLGNFDLTPAQIERLTSGGLEADLEAARLAPQVQRALERRRDEDIYEWARRIKAQLDAAGLDSSAISENLKQLRFTDEDRARLNPELERLAQRAVGQLAGETFTGARQTLNQNVVAAIQAMSNGRIKLGDIVQLPNATYEKLAELLILDARGAIDPRVLAIQMSELLDKPKPGKAFKFDGGKDRASERGEDYVVKVRAEFDKQQLDKEQVAFTDWIANLTPDQQASRKAGLEVLEGLKKGIKGAAEDPAKQKAFLKQVNDALFAAGQEKISWDELIAWETQLSEETGETARLELRKRFKQWAATAAVAAADGSAQEFLKYWASDLAAAKDDPAAMETFRQRINRLIPGEADDFSKAEFAQWLKDVQAKAEEDAKPTMTKSFVDFVGDLLDNPDKAITSLKNALDGILRNATNGTLTSDSVIAMLRAAGVKMVQALAAGARSQSALDAMALAAYMATKTFKDHVPMSPVKRGPLKHPFLYKAGENIVRQVAEGMAHSRLSLPPMDIAPGEVGPNGSASGRAVSIHADRIQLFSERDEQSVLRRFRFLGDF